LHQQSEQFAQFSPAAGSQMSFPQTLALMTQLPEFQSQ
jgi:hypothetical protein